MVQSEYGGLLIIGLFFLMLLGLFMQFLKSRNIKEMNLRPAMATANMFFIIIILILFLFLAMAVIKNYIL